MPRGRIAIPIEIRFWKKIDRSGGPNACWPFTGVARVRNYGNIWHNGRMRLTHRVCFELVNGREPVGVLRHTCDFGLCCNPLHLVEGTQAENVYDMLTKNRYSNGNRRGNLTPEIILLIRSKASEGATYKQLSEEFSISESTATRIVKRDVWKHLG